MYLDADGSRGTPPLVLSSNAQSVQGKSYPGSKGGGELVEATVRSGDMRISW